MCKSVHWTTRKKVTSTTFFACVWPFQWVKCRNATFISAETLTPLLQGSEKAYNPHKFLDIIYFNLPLEFYPLFIYLLLVPVRKKGKGYLCTVSLQNVNSDYTHDFKWKSWNVLQQQPKTPLPLFYYIFLFAFIECGLQLVK